MDEAFALRIRSAAANVAPEMVEFRRLLHSHPELGLDTVETARQVRSRLAHTSAEQLKPLIGNDVIAELRAGKGPLICLRADMDAVPVREASRVPHSSTADGLMHACGHDGHTAMLLGAAIVLDRLRDDLPVSVRFVFQPGEELICAGKELVKRGACQGCKSAYALHAWPGLPLGTVATREGTLFAAGSHFTIRVRGKGCHGALPERGNNPIPIASHIVERLTELHRRANARDGTVVSVCAFRAGESSNVIPDHAVIHGTARYLTTETGDRIEREIRIIAEEVAFGAGAGVDIQSVRDYDLPVINTPRGHEAVRAAAESAMPGSYREIEKPAMTMEDFAYYLDGRDGAMALLGMGDDAPNLHSPRFDFNDAALETGIALLCSIAAWEAGLL